MGAEQRFCIHREDLDFFFFSYLSISFPNRDIIKLLWKHFISTKKVQLNHDIQCIFISAPPHACSNRLSHFNGVLSSYTVSIYPSRWSLPAGRTQLRIFAYWQSVLTDHWSQPLSCPSPPSLLFSDIIYKMHTKKKYLSNQLFLPQPYFPFFPPYFWRKAKNHLFHVLIQYLLH